ncbi:MAG: adenylate/guanylate cyclase domain-containing protein [Ignavibacteria bacterium]|nr:adenylate/guanylate cyclase domain-containing protein [Ignavibacteria bacterium]
MQKDEFTNFRRVRRHRFLLLILLQILFYSYQFNHSQILNVKRYSTDENLTNSIVTSVTQDKDGYLWVSTLNGVNRYDGVNFKNFYVKDGLVDRVVISSFADSKGNVWFGTYAGLSKYKNGKFTNFDSTNGFRSYPIWDIIEDDSGNIWTKIKAEGLAVIRPDNSIKYYNSKNGLPDEFIITIAKANNNKILFLTKSGISFFDGKNVSKLEMDSKIQFQHLKYMIVDSENNIWLTGNSHYRVLIKYDFKKTTIYSIKDGLIDAGSTSLHIDKHNNIWVGTKIGLCRFSNGKFTKYSEVNGIPSSTILSIFSDFEGNTWLGTYEDGLVKIPPPAFSFYNKSSGLSSEIITNILGDHIGNLYLSTLNGLNIFNPKSNSFKEVKLNVSRNFIQRIKVDNQGNIFMASPAELFSYKDEKLNLLGKVAGTTRINALFIDSKNNIWIGTNNDSKTYMINSDSKIKFDSTTQVLDIQANGFFEEKSGILWIGTSEGVLVKYHNNIFTKITDSIYIKDHPLQSLHVDDDGTVWIATQGAGLIKYKNGIFKQYLMSDGLSSNECYLMLKCDKGFYWIGTDKGLNKFDGKKFSVYKTYDGLPTNHFMFNSSHKDPSGILWFGTNKGLVRFDPNVENQNTTPPPIHITKVAVINSEIDFTSSIELDHSENHITIDFSGIAFNNSDKISYRYRLNNIQDNWTSTKSRQVNFSFIPPGEYLFEVYAISENGLKSPVPAALTFIIYPPFWNTIWFRILVVLLLIAIGLIYYKRSIKVVENRNIYLEKMVNERTQELRFEQSKSEELIKSIIPEVLIPELKETGHVQPKKYKCATILFSDFQDFTTTSNQLEPDILIKELNDIFENFDRITTSNKIEKLKTIGDSYMIAGGIPTESTDHAVRVVKAAIEMQNFLKERNKISSVKWNMRIGINSGKVIAGIVGLHKFSYDVWGDTVNVASFMERECDPGKINISETTYELIKDRFECFPHRNFKTKWNHDFTMYYINKEV